jgi:hypothetical protein
VFFVDAPPRLYVAGPLPVNPALLLRLGLGRFLSLALAFALSPESDLAAHCLGIEYAVDLRATPPDLPVPEAAACVAWGADCEAAVPAVLATASACASEGEDAEPLPLPLPPLEASGPLPEGALPDARADGVSGTVRGALAVRPLLARVPEAPAGMGAAETWDAAGVALLGPPTPGVAPSIKRGVEEPLPLPLPFGGVVFLVRVMAMRASVKVVGVGCVWVCGGVKRRETRCARGRAVVESEGRKVLMLGAGRSSMSAVSVGAHQQHWKTCATHSSLGEVRTSQRDARERGSRTGR